METKLARKIVINGKEYASADEMPPEIRALYDKAMEAFADRDGNQVPDFLEGKGPGVWQSAKQIWGVAREARRLGIDQVTFGAETTATTTGAATSGSAPEAPQAPTPPQAPQFTMPTTGPLEPSVTGGGGIRSFVALVVLIAGVLFVARRLGLF